MAASESGATIEQRIIDRLLESYLRNRCEVAEAIDTRIDLSGNLLGWLRELASRSPVDAIGGSLAWEAEERESSERGFHIRADCGKPLTSDQDDIPDSVLLARFEVKAAESERNLLCVHDWIAIEPYEIECAKCGKTERISASKPTPEHYFM